MKMTSIGIYWLKDGAVSAPHSGFGVNGGPLKDRLQTTKMFHSLVMYYLHTSESSFHVCQRNKAAFCCLLTALLAKEHIAPLLEVTGPLDLLAELFLQAIIKHFKQAKLMCTTRQTLLSLLVLAKVRVCIQAAQLADLR